MRFENNDNASSPSTSEIWWGVGASDGLTASPPDPPAGLIVEFLDDIGNNYATWVKAAAAEPASYTWSVQFRKVKNSDPKGGIVSSTMENIDTRFVPQDYSVVLENTDLGIHINLRAGSDNVKGTNIRTSPILAGFYVDNAVNIQSIENLDPLIGTPGNNLRLRVTVKNTGRYTDNENIWYQVGGEIDPTYVTTFFNLGPENENNVIINTNLPAGTENIIVSTDGSYASDNDYITAIGIARGVKVLISPPEGRTGPGENLYYTVTVKNTSNFFVENFTLDNIDNAGWPMKLDNAVLRNIPVGENNETILTVTIPENAISGTIDNITVNAICQENTTVRDNASCTALALSEHAPRKPVLVSPENGTYTVDTTPTFVWLVGENATNHRIEVDNDFDFSSPVDNVVLGASDSTWTENHGLARGIYYWRVWAVSSAGENVSENTWNFTVTPPGKPVLVSPENGTLTSDTTPTFVWLVGAGVTYHRIEVDNDSDFSSPVDNRLLDDTDNTWTKPPLGYVSGTYFWRVWAVSSAGENVSENTWNFRVTPPGKPVLISPINGENTTDTTPTFTWARGEGATSHRIEIDDDNVWTNGIIENKLLSSPNDNTWESENQLGPRDTSTTYFWRVWAVSSAGENSSEIGNFTENARAGVSISIFPGSQENQRGITTTFSVTVVNTGNIMDTENLSVSDNESWNPTLDNYLFLNVGPGENRTTTLRVTVSLYSRPGTSDNITITATSQYNTSENENASCISRSTLPSATFHPTDDADVHEATPNSNYGNDWLVVGRLDNGAVISFLKFELSAIPLSSTIESASLFLFVNNNDPNITQNVSSNWVEEDNWNENTITWEDKPSIGGVLDSRSILNGSSNQRTWYSWNVTSFVENEFGGDNTVSFCMVNGGEDATAQFNSKEGEYLNADPRFLPYLNVVYSPTDSRSPLVTISPSHVNDYPGKTISYLVTVQNVGWANSSYTLEVGDDADPNWTMSLSKTSIGPLSPSASDNTTILSVTIPSDVNPGTVDSIFVTARDNENDNIWDQRSCTAGFLLPTVSISPSYQENLRGENLVYTVTVTNNAAFMENFAMSVWDKRLSVWDDARPDDNWSRSLDNILLENIPPGGSKTTTLTVTVSWNSPGTDNITVIATSQRDSTIKKNGSCVAHTTPLEMIVYPTDDAYVWESSPDSNYENADLLVGRKTDNIRSFLKFDLSSIPGSIENVQLSLNVEGLGIIGVGENVQCHSVDDDSWSEGTITWNNKPSIGITLDNQLVTTPLSRDNWDVTSFVKGESEGDNTVSFCMVGDGENTTPDNYIIFFSKEFESSDFWPYLLVGYTPSSDENFALISISPEYKSRLRGENIVFTVAVQNQGWDTRTYTLEVNDNSGWPLMFSENLLEDVLPGENRVTTLIVTVPENAAPCTSDNITVIARSDRNENFSASCVAHSAVVAMSINISPQTVTNAQRGRTLFYLVTLANLSDDLDLRDNYTLWITDDAGWLDNIVFFPENENTLKIDNLLSGVSTHAILSVTIPWTAPDNTQDNIAVWARDNVKSWDNENNNVENSGTCQAISGILGFQVSITPDRQENIRGAQPSYTVTVVNTGNVVDNYILRVWDNPGLYDNVVLENWGPTVSPSLLTGVKAGGSKTATLKVTVSWNSPPGTSDNITVIAISAEGLAENENIFAENSCIAYSKPTENVYPIDDSYVYQDSPNTNYGDVDEFKVGIPKNKDFDNRMRAFLKFDLRLPGGSIIDNALLYLWADSSYKDDQNYGPPDVQCWSVDNDDWSERAITWNNKPENEGLLDAQTIQPADKWFSWKVTDFVKSQFENENDQIVSFCMISSEEPRNYHALFPSKEGTNPPRLEVYYHGVNQHSVALSISPNYIGGMGVFSYSVTVQNVGWENSSYQVFHIQNSLNWPQVTLDSTQFNNIRPGENRITNLKVTMPNGTAPSTRNEITLKVGYDSVIDNVQLSGYSKCIAQFVSPIISISPPENNAPRGAKLVYTVTVTNPGTIPENFVLSVRDTAVPSWNPTLDNLSLYVNPGESLTTTENVKVSWNSPLGTMDNLIIRAALVADNSFYVEGYSTANSPPDNMKISPIDDSYVLENASDNNYGTFDNLDVGWGAEGLQGRARSFLRFYLAIPGGSVIDSAQLYLISKDKSKSPQVQCRVVNNDNWYEGTITWNDRPARGEVLDTQPINNVGVPFSWGVTDFVRNQFLNENDKMVSLCMVTASEEVQNENWVKFYSKDNKTAVSSSVLPYLLVSYRISSRSPLVTISPSNISFRDNVSYSVTVQNVGWENSSYTLENIDTLGWSISLDNNRFDNIQPGENKTTVLRVIIPENLAASTRDEIIVKATCVENTEIIGSAICTAQAAGVSRSAKVSIVPLGHPDTDWRPGLNATFAVTITNTGNIEDTYDLTTSDNAVPSWGPTLSPTSITLTGGVSGTVNLTVLIDDNSILGTKDSIRVRATSRADNTVFGDGATEAHTSSFFRKVGVSIAPIIGENLPGELLIFKVTVTNTGNVRDNFLLTVTDNAVPSWGPTLSTAWVFLENGQTRPTSENLLLIVRIPNDAVGGMMDNIQVIARSKYDNTKSDNKICIAQVTQIRRGVVVRISPTEGTAGPEENLTFTVTVTNTGNLADNYVLTRSDIAVPSWGPTLDNYSFENVPPGGNKTTTLRVTIPTGAVNNEQDTITVTARSRTDSTVENSASCTAQARGPVTGGVSVSISPTSQSGAKGTTLTFTITVSNTGDDLDTFDLTASDNQGWEIQLDADTLTINAGESTTVNLTVTVPSDASEGDTDLITITAISETDPTKSDSADCTAVAKVPGGGLLPVVVVGAAVVGGAAVGVAALLVKKGVIHGSHLRSRHLRLDPEGLKLKSSKFLGKDLNI